MNRLSVVVVAATMCAGCFWDSEVKPSGPNADQEKEGPLVVRAATFPNCPAFGGDARVEMSGALESLAIMLLSKGTEAAIDYVSKAVAKAAEKDRETFSITGMTADYLYDVDDSQEAAPHTCVTVTVAPRLRDPPPDPCAVAAGAAHWYGGKGNCGDMGKPLQERFREWKIGKPVFHGEWALRAPKGGPRSHVLPNLVKLHYPAPISDRPANKIKGVTVLVQARDPSATRNEGEIVFELFFIGEGIAPGNSVSLTAQDLRPRILPYGARWLALPGKKPAAGAQYGGPVDLSATVSETPHPNEWLQAVAKFISEKDDWAKEKATGYIKGSLDSKAKAAKAEAEADAALANDVAAGEACMALINGIGAANDLLAKHRELGVSDTPDAVKAKQALTNSCTRVEQLKRAAAKAWEAAKEPKPMCSTGRIDELVVLACPV